MWLPSNNVITDTISYIYKQGKREIQAWLYVAKYYGILLPVLVIGLIGLVVYVKPFPDSSAYLAIGQTGSSYTNIGEKFVDEFKAFGIKLKLVPTDGLVKGLEGLDSDASRVNATFYTAGAVKGEDYPKLASLGSIQFAPLWLFYRGKEVSTDDPFEYFDGKKIAIGLPGTVTNKIFRRLYLENQQAVVNGSNFLELPHADAVTMLKLGQIESMFMVDNITAPAITELLNDPSINVMSFSLADAYIRQFPFLQKITIPKGAFNIGKVSPRNEITLLASTTTILVEQSTHPSIQWGLILAANDVARNHNDYFSTTGYFPKYLDTAIPLSPVAKHYYDNGIPAVFSYFPLWLATLIDRAGVTLLTFFAFIYPAYKLISGWRGYPSKKYILDTFAALKEIQESAVLASSVGELQALQDELRKLQTEQSAAWIDDGDVKDFFILKNNTIPSVAKEIQQKIDALNKA